MIVLAQLYAMRAQLDAAIVILETALRPTPNAGCAHEREVNAGTFGQPPTKVCLDCGLKRPGVVA